MGECECSAYSSSDSEYESVSEESDSESDCSEPNFHEEPRDEKEEEEDLPDPPSLQREETYFEPSGPRFLQYTASIADSVMYREEK
jgi:hypothetical protein